MLSICSPSALSIDPSNPYVYFYLGSAYLIKKNYNQALTFFQRAEIGFNAIPPGWANASVSKASFTRRPLALPKP